MIEKPLRVRAGRILGHDALRLARARGNPAEVAERFATTPDVIETAREWYEAKVLGVRRKQAKRARKADSQKTWTAKLDALVGAQVRARGRCEAAGWRDKPCTLWLPLQWAHGVKRKAAPVLRHDPETHWCLCAGCHEFFTHNETEWVLFMMTKFPQRWARIVERRREELPRGAARVEWMKQLHDQLKEQT